MDEIKTTQATQDIEPGKDWTSSQAWAALGTAGVDAAAVYRQLRDKQREEKTK